MINRFSSFFDNQIFVAVLLIFLPLINFLNPINLKQLSLFSFVPLFFFTLAVSLLIIFFVYLIEKIFFKKSIENIYIISSLFYFFLFFYNDIKIFLDGLNPIDPDNTQLINWRYYGEISLSIILTLTILIIYINQKIIFFRKFFKTFIIFFISINILLNFLNHLKEFITSNFINQKVLTSNEINISNFKIKENVKTQNNNNVYYIIFDGMISLENAYKQKIIPNENELKKLKQDFKNIDLKYIEDSTSNYNLSYLTLASIFYLNSPINEDSHIYKNNDFFLTKLLEKNDENLLNIILKKHNYKFYYFGNEWNECINDTLKNINCYNPISKNHLLQTVESFLIDTPIIPVIHVFLRKFFDYNINENNAYFFLDNFESVIKNINNKINKTSSNFIFVHSIVPHPPYLDKTCNFNQNRKLTNYSNSYDCTINKITKIISFLKKNDPLSLIVFQGDHGWNTFIETTDNFDNNIYTQAPIINKKINSSINDEIYYRSSIFNAIRAPNKCLQNLKKPKNNSNSIKFILNCLFGYNLVYETNDHYIGFYESEKNYGKVYKVE